MKNYITKTIAAVLSAVTTFTLMSPVFATTAQNTTDDEKVLAIVYAEDGVFSSLDTAKAALLSIASDDVDICDTFENAFLGFTVMASKAIVEHIDASNAFDAHISGSYEMLDFTEEELEFSEQLYSATEMINIPQGEFGSAYTGKGTVVAVIDNGFDITHPVFAAGVQNPKIKKEDFDNTDLTDSLNASTEQSPYVSEKLPFVYNYTTKSTDVFTLNNHGTHVAAIIGGNSEHLTGIAPDTQLLLMKVFDGSLGTASEVFVMQALEDAIVLGADVINMSIGTYSGFSEGGVSLMGQVSKKLTKAGITVVCAAGNDGTIGTQSYYNRIYGIDLPLSSHADYGTLSYPATMNDFIAVASANNTHISHNSLIHVEDGEFCRIEYTDTSAELGIIDKTFFNYFDGQTLEYVTVPGVGTAADFRRVNVSGKIALIERGEITFAEKVTNAGAYGAVAAIVYNNVDEEELTYMEISGCRIPAVFISKKDGDHLKSAYVHELVFDSKLSGFEENPDAYRISDFSSYGTTPELKIKPDITAVGEKVYSAASGGNYTSLSGTSMATPFVSGAAALFAEKLNSTESEYIAAKRTEFVKTALMNAAVPLKNPDTGAEYSPRVQGAGLVSVEAAINTPVLLTDVDGNPSSSLGDNLGDIIEIKIDLQNLSTRDLDVKISASLLADSAIDVNLGVALGKKRFNSLVSEPMRMATVNLKNHDTNINRNAENGGFEAVTLNAGETRTLSVIINQRDDKNTLKESFENGFFIDGFIYVEGKDFSCSLPFTGFNGDFDLSPAFDDSVYGSPFLYGNALVSRADESYAVIGSNDLSINGNAQSKYAAFSPNGDGKLDSLYLTPSLLRNTASMSFKIIDVQTGKIIFKGESKEKRPKSELSPNTFMLVWDGGDDINLDYTFPTGEYTLVLSATLASGSASEKLEIPFYIDNERPMLESAELVQSGESTLLNIMVNDNIGVREVTVYTDGETTLSDIDDGDNIFTFDITNLKGETVWTDITDYAMNSKTEKAYVFAGEGE